MFANSIQSKVSSSENFYLLDDRVSQKFMPRKTAKNWAETHMGPKLEQNKISGDSTKSYSSHYYTVHFFRAASYGSTSQVILYLYSKFFFTFFYRFFIVISEFSVFFSRITLRIKSKSLPRNFPLFLFLLAFPFFQVEGTLNLWTVVHKRYGKKNLKVL